MIRLYIFFYKVTAFKYSEWRKYAYSAIWSSSIDSKALFSASSYRKKWTLNSQTAISYSKFLRDHFVFVLRFRADPGEFKFEFLFLEFFMAQM